MTKPGLVLRAERQTTRGSETGRAVTSWANAAGRDLGFDYHQHMFDARRHFASFVSDRSGSWQAWRVRLDDGTLAQVTDFERFGYGLSGSNEVDCAAHSAAYVSRRSGRLFVAGRQRTGRVDPDTTPVSVSSPPIGMGAATSPR